MFIDKFNEKEIKYEEERKSIRIKKAKIDDKAKKDKEKLDAVLDALKGDIESYGYFVQKNSIFKLIDILPVLSDLLTFYNGDNYSYYIKDNKGYILTGKLNKSLEIFGFVKIDDLFKDLNLISKLSIDELIMSFNISKVGDANCLEFYSYNSIPKSLRYYTEVETEDEKIIKDFIDYVIDYKINNSKSEISLEDLKTLEKEYLKSKRTDIIAFYKNLDLDEQRELNDKQASRRLKLDKLN